MKLYIVLTIAMLTTLIQLETINGYGLWSDNVTMCHDYIDLFCMGNFKEKHIETKVLPNHPMNRQKRKVADECCKTRCTIRYIYDKYCANRTINHNVVVDTNDDDMDYDTSNKRLHSTVITTTSATTTTTTTSTTPRTTTIKTTKTTKRRTRHHKHHRTTTITAEPEPPRATTTVTDKSQENTYSSQWWIYPVGMGPWTLE